MSVEQNKIVAERFFEEVFNNKKVELVDELVAGGVVDHNKIIFAQPEGPSECIRGLLLQPATAAYPPGLAGTYLSR